MTGKKKTLLGCLFILLCTMILAMPVSAAGAELNKTEASAVVGKTVRLKVKNTSKKVTWSSSNTNVATVNSKGLVTAKKAGTATIKAKAGSKTLKCRFTVKENVFSSKLRDWSKVTALKNTGSSTIRAQIKKMQYDSQGWLRVRFVFQNDSSGKKYTMKNATITIRENNSKGKILAKGSFSSSSLVTVSSHNTADSVFVFTGTDTRRVVNLNKLEKVYFKITVNS